MAAAGVFTAIAAALERRQKATTSRAGRRLRRGGLAVQCQLHAEETRAAACERDLLKLSAMAIDDLAPGKCRFSAAVQEQRQPRTLTCLVACMCDPPCAVQAWTRSAACGWPAA